MQHLDEGTIHAWLDGALPPAEREVAEAHVASCDSCAAAVAEARGFIAASSRILTALDGVPGGVLPAASAPTRDAPRTASAPARFTISRAWMAAAAVLVLSTVTAIAIRPRHEAAQTRLAEARAERASRADVPAAAPTPAAPAEQSANDAATNAPSLSDSAGPSPKTESPANATSPRAPAARKEVRERDKDAPMMVAEAAPSPSAPSEPHGRLRGAVAGKAPSRSAPSAVTLDAKTAPLAAQSAPAAPAAISDSVPHRRIVLGQMVVTGMGLSSVTEKLGAAIDSAAPQLVSRSTSTERGDTVVTTIYTVHGVPVTLVDPSSREEVQRSTASNFSDQVMAKARAPDSVHSITWSDSTGRTRTLRGALSSDELQRLKERLFGATP